MLCKYLTNSIFSKQPRQFFCPPTYSLLHKNLHKCILLIGLLCSCQTTLAREGLFFEIDSQYNYVNFVEWDKGYAINKESGSIPTQGFTLGYQKPEKFYFEYSRFTGEDSVGYLGYSQVGDVIKTSTDYDLESSQYIFGKTFQTTVVYLGYEVNSRHRYINASEISQPLSENLKQKQGFVGFKQTVIHTDNYLVDFRFNAKMAFSSYMNVDFNEQFDDSGIHLGMDYTLISNLYIGRKLPRDWILGFNFIYEFTAIEQSDSVLLTQDGNEFGAVFYHPYTELETVSMGLSLGKTF